MIVKNIIVSGELKFIHIYYHEDELERLLIKFDGFDYNIYNYKRYNIISINMSNIDDKYRNYYVQQIKGEEKNINKSRKIEKAIFNSVIILAKEKSIERKWSNPEFKKMYCDKVDEFIKSPYNISLIQAVIRGHLCRKELLRLKDGMTFDYLNECIDKYNEGLLFIKKMNEKMNTKKIRNENFPSHVSENIAKFAISKKYKVIPDWDCKGDLVILSKQLEIKGFMSSGPLSFGPKEPWHYIYFVDGLDTMNKQYKVYEIKLSNDSETWRNIIISGKDTPCEDCYIPDNLESLNRIKLTELCVKRGLNKTGKKEVLIQRIKNDEVGSGIKPKLTYGDIADADKRGKLRAPFYETIKPQIENYCKLIFDGHISELE